MIIIRRNSVEMVGSLKASFKYSEIEYDTSKARRSYYSTIPGTTATCQQISYRPWVLPALFRCVSHVRDMSGSPIGVWCYSPATNGVQ